MYLTCQEIYQAKVRKYFYINKNSSAKKWMQMAYEINILYNPGSC